MTEPIIPVRKNGTVDPWWRQVVEILRPDGAVNVDCDHEAASTFASRADLEMVSIGRIDRDGVTQFCANPGAVWRPPPQAGANAAEIATSGGDLWEAVAAGDLTEEMEQWSSEHGIRYRRPRSRDELARAQLIRSTGIDRTADQLIVQTLSGGWPSTALVWVTKPNAYRDLLFYWNIRALRDLGFGDVPMVLLPDREIEHWVGLPQQLEDQLRRRVDGSIDVALCSIGVKAERLVAIADLLQLRPAQKVVRHNSISIPEPPPREPPFTYQINHDVRRYLLGQRTYGTPANTLAQIYRDDTEVEVEGRIQVAMPGRVLASIRSSALDSLPKFSQVADEILRNATWRDNSLRFATDLRERYHVNLKIPTIADAVWTALRQAGRDPRLSDKGQLAEAVERTLGSEPLLTVPSFRAILDLATPRSSHLVRAIEEWRLAGLPAREILELTEAATGRTERRFRSVSNIKDSVGPDAPAAVELLASHGYVERGLVIACGACAMTSFLPLTEVSGAATCPACRTVQSFRSAAGPTMHYRLHGLVDRASDQGALLHLRVRRQLLGTAKTGFLLPGVLIDDSEVDLAGVVDGEVYAGEVKHSASQFDNDQLERDVALTSQLGASVHVVGCAEDIPDEVTDTAARLTKRFDLRLVLCDSSGVRSPGDESE